MSSSLTSKIRWLIALPLCGIALVAIAAFVILSRHEIGVRTGRDVHIAASSLGSFLAEDRAHLQVETRMLAEVPYIRALVVDDANRGQLASDSATIQDQVKRYHRFLNQDGLMIFDASGRLLGGAGPIMSELGNKLSGLGTDEALAGREWSGTVKTQGGLVLAATAPLMVGVYPKGGVICYSEIGKDAAGKLGNLMSAEVAFVDGGRVIASSSPLNLVDVPQGAPVYVEIGGKEYVGQYSPFSQNLGPSAGFIAFRRVDEIIGPSRAFLLAFLAILVPTILLTVLVSNRFAKNVVKPLDGVVEAAIALERGEWPGQFAVDRGDEIGLLQTAFNRMTTSLQDHEQKLLAMIDMDPLTEIPNHRRFKEIIGLEIAHAHAKSQVLSMVLFDIDHFSDFNRAKGLVAGDAVLKEIASILLDSGPAGAQFARYGGEEFAVLLPHYALDQARGFAERVRVVFEAEHAADRLTLSAGCAQFSVTTDRPEGLCLAAELALAQAKQLGRNQVCDFGAIAGEQGSDPFELHKFLQNGTLATIQALAAAVDAKDSYTKGHSQRVAQYAADLCRFVGGSDQEVELVFRTGTLHDVGKIGVPDAILKKQGPLTAEERAVMETHPALGEVIVRKVPQLQDTLPGVRHHHERWDGKGYPDGLEGQQIPRLARILAIADTYDAMTSDRPYRKGMAAEFALSEIEKNAGIQFDADMALAFVRMRRDGIGLHRAA